HRQQRHPRRNPPPGAGFLAADGVAMKTAVLRKKAIPALLLVVVLAVLFADEMFEWLYPIKYDEEISAASAETGVDKLLLAAIIRTESNYKPDKVSAKGAVGL